MAAGRRSRARSRQPSVARRADPSMDRYWSAVSLNASRACTHKIAIGDSDVSMSALVLFADSVGHFPRSEKCHKPTYAGQQIAALFDHLVGAGEQRRGNVDAERLGGLQIDAC